MSDRQERIARQLEANLAETRARLSHSVEALAEKADVKAQAEQMVAEGKEQAVEKLTEVREQAVEKLIHVKDQAVGKLTQVKDQSTEKLTQVKDQSDAKAGSVKEQVVTVSRDLLHRLQVASRPVQVSVGAAPLALLLLIIVRRARS